MDNGMENMLDMYLFETNSLLEQLDELLIEAEKAGDFTVDDVNEIFRIMHTVKGSSAMMEFTSLMQIAHHIEDLFFFIRENGLESLDISHKSTLFDLMFRSTDMLRAEVSKVENNEPLSDNVDHLTQEINSFLKKISKDNNETGNKEKSVKAPEPQEAQTPAAAPAPAAPAVNLEEIRMELADCPDDKAPFFLRIFYDEGCGMENLRAFMLISSLKESGLEFGFYPKDVETNSQTCGIIVEKGFFLTFGSRKDADMAISQINNLNNIRSYELIENVHAATSKTAETQNVQASSTAADHENTAAANTPAASAGHQMPSKQNLISVNLTKLDNLVAIVGEIVITESMVTSSPEIQNLKNLDSFLKATRQLRKLTDDLQDIVMSLRMVPISGVFQKMNRIVRDMKQKLKKDVRLTIIGENTEVDKSIVDSIGDPIMHIVRNSMDHGIEETAEERIAAGKNPQGELILSASHTTNEVIISISDDGRGVNPAGVLAKAKKNGILTKPESEYTHKEILALLLAPGFSTNEVVTEFSGRGVGMDVVKKNVENIGGTITITSELGKGMCTTLKIPLTMAIVDGMEIAVGKSVFTIPIANIRQSFKVKNEEVIYDTEGNEIIKCMNQFYPIIRIHRLYNIETEITSIEDGILVWVESGDKSYCLFVDDLLGEQQVVVKPLPVYLNSFNIKDSGISGCTILGDGNISIILDVLNLYAAAHNQY
ncbi:chemotaxis protein CheA [Lacrimispora saccharolytica]|uniref:Chemotaxis protein CheA n=1 Tax=Lacrimispora saccharolytica (strain ATCC 35040 / DSM 2544 / NRCC 2533 / WM1) TaxID=610130 RepID=D9R9X7_LACSW|nr:chemotaxis protein CheA [Lacrimispora saccharolytica]ADL05949.1 CheA signal transduction histidine kinase [[Clostridium] saccharolyticum WM1]QRV19920.1 chemotaxis protein CheA [Lacrimispora saccharolytica]